MNAKSVILSGVACIIFFYQCHLHDVWPKYYQISLAACLAALELDLNSKN